MRKQSHFKFDAPDDDNKKGCTNDLLGLMFIGTRKETTDRKISMSVQLTPTIVIQMLFVLIMMDILIVYANQDIVVMAFNVSI